MILTQYAPNHNPDCQHTLGYDLEKQNLQANFDKSEIKSNLGRKIEHY
jgi:hypothetical protein